MTQTITVGTASVLTDLLDESGATERVLSLLAKAVADGEAAESARSVQPLIEALPLSAHFKDEVLAALYETSR